MKELTNSSGKDVQKDLPGVASFNARGVIGNCAKILYSLDLVFYDLVPLVRHVRQEDGFKLPAATVRTNFENVHSNCAAIQGMIYSLLPFDDEEEIEKFLGSRKLDVHEVKATLEAIAILANSEKVGESSLYRSGTEAGKSEEGTSDPLYFALSNVKPVTSALIRLRNGIKELRKHLYSSINDIVDDEEM